MSLTEELKTKGSWTRSFFERRFPDLRAVKADLHKKVLGADTIRPADTTGYPWGTVGMAFDYRSRFNFPASASLPSRWAAWVADPAASFVVASEPGLPIPLVAEWGAAREIEIYKDCTWRRAAGAFFGTLASLLARTKPYELGVSDPDEEQLCRYCFVLGLYEQFQRTLSAWGSSPLIDLWTTGGVDELLGLCPAVAVNDLAALNAAFVASQRPLLAGEAVLNPRFGDSALVGGADGDLIVDGAYIDIKTTIVPGKPSPSQWPWELLGYVLLDHEDRFALHSVGLYLSRQARLVTWTLDEFVSLLAGAGADTSLGPARVELHEELVRRSEARKRLEARRRNRVAIRLARRGRTAG